MQNTLTIGVSKAHTRIHTVCMVQTEQDDQIHVNVHPVVDYQVFASDQQIL